MNTQQNKSQVTKIEELVKPELDNYFFDTERSFQDAEDLAEKVIEKTLSNLWVSVKEALPEPREDDKDRSELCFCREQCDGNVFYSIQAYVYLYGRWAYNSEFVTHWMAIPKLSEEEK